MKKILFLVCVALLVPLLVAGCRGKTPPVSKNIDLVYYRLFDDEDVIQPLIDAYRQKNPLVKVTYKKFVDAEAYEDLILNELAEGKGPDIFQVSNSSLPRFFGKIAPLDSISYTPEKIQENFVTVVTNDFVKADPADGKQKIYGIPLYVDVPALYYNKKTFDTRLPETGKPPATWAEIANIAPQFRTEDESKNLLKGAIALGDAESIKGGVDVLLNLMLQEGAAFYDKNYTKTQLTGRGAERALSFFTNFADPEQKNYSWSKTLVSKDSELKEVEAFLTGKVAMMVGYADLHPRLEVHLKNLQAKGFDVISLSDIGFAPLPQKTTKDEDKKVLAKYYADTVSRTSKNALVAWDFLSFISNDQNALKYAKASKRPTSRRSVITEQKRDPILSVFVNQLGFAESIPMANEKKFYEFLSEAITKVAAGDNSAQALSAASEKVDTLMPKDGLFPPYVKKAAR